MGSIGVGDKLYCGLRGDNAPDVLSLNVLFLVGVLHIVVLCFGEGTLWCIYHIDVACKA